MPRLSSLFPLGLAAVASAVLLAPPSVSFVDSATVAIGDICGNADNCGSDGVCLYNHCIPASAVEEGTNGTASSASFAGKGNRCSADDCCGNNLLCLNIVGLGGAQQCWSRDDIGGGADDNSGSNPGFTVVQCTGSPKEGADLSTPNGGGAGTIGQPCGAQSCCTDGLVCVDLAGAGICTESVQGVTTIACNGTPPTPTPNPGPIPTPTPTPTPTPSPPSASETGTNVEPTPVPSSPNGGATGTNSGPTTPTPTPTPTTPPTTATGNGGNTGSTDQPAAGSLGQTCGGAEQNGCCTGGLVCDATSGTCRPNVPGLASLGCNGAQGTPATQTVPVSCSVSKVCAAGSTCIANYCVVDAQVTAGQVWGFGNQCSATVCCPNKLVCLTDAGGRCGVQTGNLRTTTCTASGAATSGQTITSNGQAPAPITPISSGNGGNGNGGSNGATSLTIGSTSYFAALAGLAVMVLTLVA